MPAGTLIYIDNISLGVDHNPVAAEVDPRKPVDLDTPTKLIKLGIDETVINLYSETPSTGFKLVEMSGAKLRNIFRNIKQD